MKIATSLKKRSCIIFFILYSFCTNAQNSVEQLKAKLSSVSEDTTYVNLCLKIANQYFKSNLDSALLYSQKAVKVAEKTKNKEFIFKSTDILGYSLLKKGSIAQAKPILAKAYAFGKTLPLSDQYFFNIFHFAMMYLQTKNSDSSLYYLNIAYTRSLSYSNKIMECQCYNNFGEHYRSFSEYDKAIDYFFKALKCNEKRNLADPDLEFYALIGLGSINYTSEKYDNAIEYFEKAANSNYAKTTAGVTELAILYNNIGACYYTIGSSSNDTVMKNKGISYFHKVLEQNIRSGNKISMGRTNGNLGSVYANDGKYEIAKPYFEKAIQIAVETNNKLSEAKNANNLGDLYSKLNDSAKAIEYYFRAVSIAKASRSKEVLILSYDNLNKFYAERKDYVLAYDYQRKYVQQKDSLLNEQNQSKLATLKTQYDTEKKDQQIQLLAKDKLLKGLFIDKQEGELLKQKSEAEQQSFKIKILNDEKRFSLVLLENETIEKEKKLRENELLTQQNELSQKTLKQQKVITLLIALGLIATLIAIVLVFRQYKEKQKANETISLQKYEVEIQKEIIEEKQKEITDSIHYAKRIQKALLASDTFLQKQLPEYFILYKPKDIVSGDFYWAAKTPTDQILIMTGDCTGHGVPGAFMSLLGVNFLNEIITDKKITRPDLIFNQLRNNIISALNPEGTQTEATDGMDAVLCSFDFSLNQLQFVSANNPLWVIRDSKLIEYAPDKMPIGKYFDELKDFRLQTLQLEKGDIIYTFTDGYADQFGGERGKKFKYKPLQKLLLSVCHLTMNEQRDVLNKTIEDWKGNLEQVDDILFIGIRI